MELTFPPVRRAKTFRDYTGPFESAGEAREVLSKTSFNELTVEDIKRSLSYLMEERPIETYGIALDILRASDKTRGFFVRDVEDIVRSAARKSLHDPLPPWSTETDVAFTDYVRLISYHARCAIRLLEFFTTGGFIKKTGTEWVWYNTRCDVCPPTSNKIVVQGEMLEKARPTMWWAGYWEKIVTSVRDSPCEELVEKQYIWNSTLQALAKDCPTCHEVAEREFPLFKAKLVLEITKIINGVRIRFVD